MNEPISEYEQICVFLEEGSDPEQAERAFYHRYKNSTYPEISIIPAPVEGYPPFQRALISYFSSIVRPNYQAIVTLSSSDKLKVVPFKKAVIDVNERRYVLRFDSLKINRGFSGCMPYAKAFYKAVRSDTTDYLLLSY